MTEALILFGLGFALGWQARLWSLRRDARRYLDWFKGRSQ